MRRQPAAFIDKDGTLIENIPYNADPSRFRLMPGAVAGLCRLAEAGYQLVVVSNQSGVALGYFGEQALAGMTTALKLLLVRHSVRLAGCYFCPHHPDGRISPFATLCDCRKPNPGMLHQAARELNLDLNRSWMIGDILDDVEAGNRAGCRSILIDNGGETKWLPGAARQPLYIASNLDEASTQIMSHVDAQRTALPHRKNSWMR